VLTGKWEMSLIMIIVIFCIIESYNVNAQSIPFKKSLYSHSIRYRVAADYCYPDGSSPVEFFVIRGLKIACMTMN